jgi:hypothetical protein
MSMSTYTRWARRMRAPLAAALLLGVSIAHAADIALQNVNFASSDRQVIVKGKLDGFNGMATVTLRDLATDAVMATAAVKSAQFGFRVKVPTGVPVPCEISVEATDASSSVVSTAEVRNARGICGQYTVLLAGVVTDDVIPFATVTVVLGGVTYTTVADANGRYTLPITSAILDELVKIEAAGTSPATGEPIEFVNLIGSFSRLLDDQLINGGAEGNVTNVTTASYVLVLQANGGEPTNAAELANAETSVDATELLRLAALIKLIVDDPAYTLPAGETSLLAFVSNPQLVAAYLETVLQEDLDAAVASILQDSNLVAGFVAAEIPSRYFVIPASQPGYLARQGQILEFNSDDGTGRLLDYNNVIGQPISEAYTWTVAEGRLIVNLAEPLAFDYFEFLSNTSVFQSLLTEAERDRIVAANGPGRQVPVRNNVLGYAYTRVVDGVLVDSASVETRFLIEVLPFPLDDGTIFTPSLPPEPRTGRAGQSLRASIDVQARPFAATCPGADGAVCVPGQWLANLIYSPGILAGGSALAEAPYGDVVTFSGDLTLTGLLSGLTATWAVDDGGALVISYSNGVQQKIQIVDTLGIEFGVFNEISSGGDRYATYTINVKAADAFVLTNSYLASTPGKFWQGEINSWIPSTGRWNSDGSRTLASYFGWQFFENNNDAINVQAVSLADCGGDGQNDDPYASLALSQWQPANGGVGIPRGNGSRLRTWYPAASTTVNGDRQFYVIEDERFVSGPSAGRLFFPPRINFLREIDAPWTCSN